MHQIVSQYPGLTAAEIETLLDKPAGTISNRLHAARKAGLIRAEKTVELNKPLRYYPADGKPDAPFKRSNTLQRKEARIKELEAWKADAIARFPELGVDPKLLAARRRLAEFYSEADRAAVLAGEFDNSIAMRVLLAD